MLAEWRQAEEGSDIYRVWITGRDREWSLTVCVAMKYYSTAFDEGKV